MLLVTSSPSVLVSLLLSINLITIVPDGIMSGLRPAPLFLAGPTADLPPPTPPPHPPRNHLHRHHRPQRSLRCNVLSMTTCHLLEIISSFFFSVPSGLETLIDQESSAFPDWRLRTEDCELRTEVWELRTMTASHRLSLATCFLYTL